MKSIYTRILRKFRKQTTIKYVHVDSKIETTCTFFVQKYEKY